MVPHQGRGTETPNFRNVKESQSVDISGARALGALGLGVKDADGSSSKGLGIGDLKGVPLDSGLETPGADVVVKDPFEEFESVTLHHDGDDDHHHSHAHDLSPDMHTRSVSPAVSKR